MNDLTGCSRYHPQAPTPTEYTCVTYPRSPYNLHWGVTLVVEVAGTFFAIIRHQSEGGVLQRMCNAFQNALPVGAGRSTHRPAVLREGTMGTPYQLDSPPAVLVSFQVRGQESSDLGRHVKCTFG